MRVILLMLFGLLLVPAARAQDRFERNQTGTYHAQVQGRERGRFDGEARVRYTNDRVLHIDLSRSTSLGKAFDGKLTIDSSDRPAMARMIRFAVFAHKHTAGGAVTLERETDADSIDWSNHRPSSVELKLILVKYRVRENGSARIDLTARFEFAGPSTRIELGIELPPEK